MNNTINIQEFYNRFGSKYTESIKKFSPYYEEMISTLFEFLPENIKANNILDLGCGTGNLTILINKFFPDANIIGVDISEEALKICSQRINSDTFITKHIDLKDIDYPEHSFDMVFSSLALHHLNDVQKEELIKKVHKFLKPEGYFIYCDRMKEGSEYIRDYNYKLRIKTAREKGVPEKDIENWSEHELHHDTPDSLYDQLDWMIKADFKVVDCVWRKARWGTIFSQK